MMTSAARSSAQRPSSFQDSTGKERDAETGLDYFGAKYYSGAQGRFISADPLMASADIEEPQSWNRYAYVSNNPLRFVDDDGNIKRDAEGKPVWIRDDNVSPIPIPHASGPSAVMQPGFLFADNGDPILALKNESGDPRFDTNCHGTTFADGLYWINGTQVGTILAGDNYKPSNNIQQINDVAIYREKGNPDPVHSATVVGTENVPIIKQWNAESGFVDVSGKFKSYYEQRLIPELQSKVAKENNPKQRGAYEQALREMVALVERFKQ